MFQWKDCVDYEKKRRVYISRVAGGDCDHRSFDVNAVAGAEQGQRAGEKGMVSGVSAGNYGVLSYIYLL